MLLHDVLDSLGFSPRPEQDKLYQELLNATEDGVIVQAGTGTGKSIAMLCAAAAWRKSTGLPSIVVTPTKILMDQYALKDAPAVAKATGMRIVTLKGRKNYVCTAAPAFKKPKDQFEQIKAQQLLALLKESAQDLESPVMEVGRYGSRFGCPGSSRHKKDLTVCEADTAKTKAFRADVIITNLHVLILDAQLDAESAGEIRLLPEFGFTGVDEAHTFESTMRDFSAISINRNKLEILEGSAPDKLMAIMDSLDRKSRFSFTVEVDGELVTAIKDVSEGKEMKLFDEDDGDEDEPSVAGSAKKILDIGQKGVYRDGHAVLYFEPSTRNGTPAKLTSSWINLAGSCRSVLTRTPVAMVSATIPSTLAGCVGLEHAVVTDVGHPFDYSTQGRLFVSRHGGSYKDAKEPLNFEKRAGQVLQAIRATNGGCLLLFSAMKDLNTLYDYLTPDLLRDGRLVLQQDSLSDKKYLTEQFVNDGRAVLFGSKSFAAGFDVPGEALELVVVWKMPYPSRDPIHDAIKRASYKRYRDLMLVDVTQAVGRLIRSTTDTGTVFVVDARGKKDLVDKSDPMIAHLSQFRCAMV
jgi:Rad3-related DNA helicase